MPSRSDTLRKSIDRGASIIEIGPSHNPIAPKADGWNTKIVDVATRSELVEKYQALNVDVSQIEDVDFVWKNGPITSAIPRGLHGTFDVLIASHVIEHTPDIVDFFRSAEALLNPAGVMVLAIPDKRFCFDCFRPLTLTGDVLLAFKERRSRHTKRSLIEVNLYGASAEGAIAWGPHPIKDISLISSFDIARGFLESEDDARGRLPYVDAHAWVFTPSSFQLVLLELARFRLTDWRIDEIGPTVAFEFHVWLRRGGAEAAAVLPESELYQRRLCLLKQTLLETKEQIEFLATEQPPDTNHTTGALETPKAENEKLPCERDDVARNAKKWFEAIIAAVGEHNTFDRATKGRRRLSWWRALRQCFEFRNGGR